MYVCVCVYVFVCMYVCMYVCVCMYVYVYVYVYVRIFLRIVKGRGVGGWALNSRSVVLYFFFSQKYLFL